MASTYANGPDVSGWQGKYKNDGKFELFKLWFVIQKAAQGLWDYTDPNTRNYKNWWKAQFDSIKSFKIRLFYHWYETELNPIEQAKLAVKILNKRIGKIGPRLYIGMAIDYESYENGLNKTTALGLKTYIDYVLANKPKKSKFLLYCNYSIYKALVKYLGAEYIESLDLWIAGGKFYNQKLTGPLDDSVLAPIPRAKIWQWSADKNEGADELDFSDNEKESIDVNRFNGTPLDLYRWAGVFWPWLMYNRDKMIRKFKLQNLILK